jgi:hypothetical protein
MLKLTSNILRSSRTVRIGKGLRYMKQISFSSAAHQLDLDNEYVAETSSVNFSEGDPAARLLNR